MEKWQMTQIRKNLPNLLAWTNCNTQFLAILQAEDVLADIDMQAIKCKEQPTRKADLLYNILKTRNNAYYALVKALVETKQTGAAKLLLNTPTEKISKLQVIFFGNVGSLESLLRPDQINQIQAWLQKNISLEELLKIHQDVLHQNTPLQLLLDTIPEPYPLYIPRFLSRREILDPKLFEIKCCDIFAFKNVERAELRKFVISFGIEFSSSQLLQQKITARFILLAAESHWKTLRVKVKSPLHLIRFEEETKRFLLEETSGDSDIIRQYLRNSDEDEIEKVVRNTSDDESNHSDIYLSDDESNHSDIYLLDDDYSNPDSDDDSGDSNISDNESENGVVSVNTPNCKNETQYYLEKLGTSEDTFLETVWVDNVKCICICDLPGMGKSFLLASLARKIAEKCPNRIVIFMQLQNFKLATTSSFDTQEELQFQLLAQVATSKLSQCILTELIKCRNVKLELFFDGLDEVKESQLESTTVFLQKLVESLPEARVFVTSRPVVQAELEKALRAIAYDIKPFNTETQVRFLTSHWEQTESDADAVKLEEYAKFCLKCFDQFLKEEEKIITGIPLQCKLIANVYRQDAEVYAAKNCKITIELPDNLTHSLLEIYSKFITRQLGESNCNFDCFYKTNLLDVQCKIECQVRNFHVWQALQLIFPDFASNLSEHINHFNDLSLRDKLAPGILKKNMQNKNWEFLHRTFAEYLVAEYFWKGVFRISKERRKFGKIAQVVFSTIFQLDSSLYFDWRLPCLREGVVAYFLDCMISKDQRSENMEVRLNAKMSPLHEAYFFLLEACIRSKYKGLQDLFLKATENSKLCCRTKETGSIFQFSQTNEAKVVLQWEKENGWYGELKISNGITKKFLYTAAEHCSASEYVQICGFFLEVLNIDLRHCVWPPPIHIALQRSEFELVRHFADNMSLENNGLIYECLKNTYFDTFDVEEKKLDIAQFLLSKCPTLVTETWKDKNRVYKTPIHIYQISLKALKFLVKRGCDIQIPNENGETVVYSVAKYMSDEDFLELCRFMCDDCNAKEFFLDPRNWIDYAPNFKLWAIKRSDKSLFRILCHLKLEIEFVENISSLKKLGNYDKYKKVFHSLLYCAFREGKLDFADLLLFHDKSLLELKCYRTSKVKSSGMVTATLYTAACKKLKILKFFVSRGSNVLTVNSNGQTILHLAAETKDCDFFHAVLCMLGEQWKEIQSNNIEEMKASVSHGGQNGKEPRNIFELFHWKSDLIEFSGTPLHHAVRYLKDLPLRTLDLLLLCGKNESDTDGFTLSVDNNAVNGIGQTALHTALMVGQRLELVKHLISRGADWTLTGEYDFNVAHYCAWKGLLEHLKYFVELGCDLDAVDQRGNTPLFHALASEQNLELVRYLVSAGADCSTRNRQGCNVVHTCVTYGFLEHVKYFVELGCDVNAVNKNGETPLFCALTENHSLEFVKYLVSVGADCSARNKHGSTVANQCASNGLLEHLRFFVELGCDVNLTDRDGDNALQCAAAVCSSSVSECVLSEIILMLIDAGVDKTNKNKYGKTAYNFAVWRRHPSEILKLLL